MLTDAGAQDDETAQEMARFLLASKANSTTRKYYYGFLGYKRFALQKGFFTLPTQSMHVAIYLTDMMSKGTSPSVLTAAVYSIKWAHDVSGYADPTQHAFVKQLLDASRRRDGKPVKKKDVVSPEAIRGLAEKFNGSKELLVVRDVCMIIVAFAGFLRFNELSQIRGDHIVFTESHVCLTIPKSKTDQYRQGNEVLLAKGVTVACPYMWLEKYMRMSGINPGDKKFVFRAIVKSKGVSFLVGKDKPLSYTRARECLVERLREFEPDLDLGLHSLRSGGATAAAGGSANERCIKRHGRWRSTFSKDTYVKDTVEKRLEVTKCLGL